jgi:hypothetical protein
MSCFRSATKAASAVLGQPTEMPAVVVGTKVEEPAAVAEVALPAVKPEAATVEPTAAEDPYKSESKAEGGSKKDVEGSNDIFVIVQIFNMFYPFFIRHLRTTIK